ncbi:hypothetical protein CC2G_010258 [Coprinopsis cinerea AmutBmut pab1-1]|nr:hypothetical protein CC2G_010258 [Coprinopsis cinerea AmutBmut pab1-1]
MSETAKTNRFIQINIFGDKLYNAVNSDDDEISEIEDNDMKRTWDADGTRRPSGYITVFEEMVNDVLEHDRHLLSESELDALDAFSRLCYPSRYCLVRMLLLKPGRWNPMCKFEKWKTEVGPDGLLPSIEPLCQPIKDLLALPSQPSSQVRVGQDTQPPRPEIIDLTESDDEDANSNVPGPSAIPQKPPSDDPIDRIINRSSESDDITLAYFCESDEKMSLYELLQSLTVEQLKGLAKSNKCQPGPKSTKQDFVHALLDNATSQGVLGFAMKDNKGKGKASVPLKQTQLTSFIIGKSKACPRQSQEKRLRAQILKILGRCFRVNHDFFRLVRRIHVIAFRCTEHPPKLMLPALLTRFKKRTYAEYKHERDVDIWPSRIELVHYEEALELEMHLDQLLESKPEEQPRGKTVDPKARETPATPGPKRVTMKTPRASKTTAPSTPREGEYIDFGPDGWDIDEEEEEETPEPDDPKIKKAKQIVKHLDEWILQRWTLWLEWKHHRNAGRTPALQRFEPGYIYSRMMRKVLKSLAQLQEYQRELDVIQAMLGQRLFLRGKRAKLYERRAILQTRYLHKTPEGKVDLNVLRQALEGVKEALLDDDTVLVARPSLVRRLRRLEARLKVPPGDRTVCEGELREAQTVNIAAKRIFKPDSTGKPTNRENIASYMKNNSTPNAKQPQQRDSVPNPAQRKRPGKSIWVGRNSAEVSVEQVALEYYEDLGFKGFHAETSIMTTIFGLLFWDIIFADIRGAFETKFQSAPLDIVDDSFYYARKDMIDARLEELRQGKGVEILQRHYAAHSETKTCCIGVRWDICTEQDLVEILECLGGKQLASICKLFCEDYTGRCSGAPDLIAWNAQHRICKFIEVKGPGDTPQENQKLWFDSLLAANIDVEICRVADVNDVKTHTTAKKKGRSSAAPSTRKRKRSTTKHSGSDSDVEEQNYDKFDRHCDDELPQVSSSRKRRRATDPGEPLCLQSLGAPPRRSGQ